METEQIAISELKDNPKNTRMHSEKQVNELVKSISMFGIICPVVVDENNVILVGHALKKALEKLGKETAECIVMRGLSEKDKSKLLLADNKIQSLGMDDFDAIDQLIKELGDYDIPGYNPEDLELIYGTSSLAEDQNKFKMREEEIQERADQKEKFEDKDYEVPKSVQEARQEYKEKQEERKERRFVICPECGAKVYVD